MKSSSIRNKDIMGPEFEEQLVCQHHWVIDRPAGPVSKGVCGRCGEEREFQNYIEGSGWGNDVSPEQLSGGSRLPAGIDVSTGRAESELDEDA